MTKITYDLSLLIGTFMLGAGVWIYSGLAMALMAVGALVISLTLIGAILVARKR